MKKIILAAGIAVAIFGSISAIGQDSVTLLLRKKAYDRYHEVKDTVTVRTWMNMDRMNKALIQLVEYDNQLLESYERSDSANGTMGRRSVDSLMHKPTEAANTLIERPRFQMKYLVAAFIALCILVVILIVLLLKRTHYLKKLRSDYIERDETFDTKIRRLEYLENEVLKMKTRENEVKAELEKGIIDYQAKMQTLRKRSEELANENTRLENLNTALSEGKTMAPSVIEKSEEMKQEIIVESEGVLKRVKKARK